MLDIHLSSLNRTAGEIKPDLSGLFAATPPRHTARGRDRDILVILLHPRGSDQALSAIRISDLINAAAQKFYKSAGSITSALGETADFLNSYFLDINKNLNPNQAACTAGLNLLVIREDLLFSASAGSSSSLLVHPDKVERLGAEISPQPGLGVGRSVQLRFSQNNIRGGDLILFSPAFPSGWDDTVLTQTVQLSFENLYKQLVRQGGPDVAAGIIVIAPGKGQLIRHRMSVAPVPAAPQAAAMPGYPSAIPQPSSPEGMTPENTGVSTGPEGKQAPLSRIQKLGIVVWCKITWNKIRSFRPAWAKKAGAKAATAWVTGEPKREEAASKFRTFIGRILPGVTKRSPVIPQSTMLFAAIAVPIVVVAMGVTIYLRSGRGEQHTINLQVAEYYADLATKEKARDLQEEYWTQANGWLKKAESYGDSAESQQLDAQISAALDSLQGVSRLAMVPALSSSIPKASRITRVVSRDQDLYLLDGPSGRVSRITRKNSQTYQIDFDFVCGPGGFIGKLIDIASLPPNNIQVQPGVSGGASILGVDENGNVVYCAPNANPTSKTLPQPKVNWSQIQAITLNQGVLYILDNGTGRVWRYASGEKDRSFEYSQSPSQFFDLADGQKVGDFVDLAVATDDLFLLMKNNQMVHCVYSRVDWKETTCTNPATYEDMRSGSPQPLPLNGLSFSQLAFTELPDSSIHILDKNTPSLYKFGVQLNLYRVMHIAAAQGYDLPRSKPTAFTVSPDQIVILVYGNEVYYSRIP